MLTLWLNHLFNVVLLTFVVFVLSLLICSFCFCLLLIIFFPFSTANSSNILKSKVVACVTNIDENCKNVCFESKVLNQYATFAF